MPGILDQKVKRPKGLGIDRRTPARRFLAKPGQQLVLAVTASGSGSAVIEGMDVTYRHGLQLGTQRVGGTLKLSTPGA